VESRSKEIPGTGRQDKCVKSPLWPGFDNPGRAKSDLPSLVEQAGVEYNTVEVILQRAPDLAGNSQFDTIIALCKLVVTTFPGTARQGR
jgi:hypothetical protein